MSMSDIQASKNDLTKVTKSYPTFKVAFTSHRDGLPDKSMIIDGAAKIRFLDFFFPLPFLPTFLLSDHSSLSFLHRLAFTTGAW